VRLTAVHPGALLVALALLVAAGAAPASARDLGSELPPVPRGTTVLDGPAASAARGSVRPALSRAADRGTIDDATFAAYDGVYSEALSVRRRLKGRRRAELHAVVGTLERIAARGSLSASRMPALFLQLHRNTSFFRQRGVPRSGARVEFEGSPLLFQFYPGQGLQLQPLANFGKASGMWYPCRGAQRRGAATESCGEMQALLDWLLALPSQRGKGIAWEYFFTFSGGAPPWTSAMSQATALQALARGSQLFDDPSMVSAGRRALRIFEARAPGGVRLGAPGGAHYLLYSFAPRLQVLNAFAKTVVGLYDFAEITGDARARRLFEAGDGRLRRELPRYDTGSWSLYSIGGVQASPSYHRLSRDFLEMLCKRVKHRPYCGTAGRFTLYLKRRSRGNDDVGKDTGPGPSGRKPVPTGTDRWAVALQRDGAARRLVFTRR
jgi:hypothetical protein